MSFEPWVGLDARDVIEAIGDNRFSALGELVRWLENSSNAITDFRYAPSIVTRSEAALLGLSYPRFAIRAYAPGGNALGGSFFNLRRIENLASQSIDWEVDEIADKSDKKHDYGPSALLARNKSFIADSVLKVPERFLSHRMVTSRVSSEYAESEFDGVSFMQSIRLGGGLCAQGCVWMATVLMHDHISACHGPGEISCVSANGSLDVDGPGDVRINGLSFSEIDAYLRLINVQGPVHLLDPDEGFGQRLTRTVVDAYCGSSFPIIVAVDLGRMAGSSGGSSRIKVLPDVYRQNSVPDSFIPNIPFAFQHHSVLLVGVSPDFASDRVDANSSVCLINDPSSVPFLEIDIDDLIYRRNYGDHTKYRLEDEELAGHFRLQPVLPLAVKVFVGTTESPNSREAGGSFNHGIESLFDQIAGSKPYWASIGIDAPLASSLEQDPARSSFRLVNFSQSEAQDSRNRKAILSLLPGADLAQVTSVIRGLDDHWYWIQRVPLKATKSAKSIWIVWDAESDVDLGFSTTISTEVASNALIKRTLLERSDGTLALLFSEPESNPERSTVVASSMADKPSDQSIARNNVRPGIVSSCFPKDWIVGLDNVRKLLVAEQTLGPAELLPIELYVAMERDARELANDLKHDFSDRNVVRLLSAAYRRTEFHKWIERVKNRYSACGLTARGIASFIPEVSSVHMAERESAIKALAALQEMALRLNGIGEAVRFIEIVGGTLFSGLIRRVEIEDNQNSGSQLCEHYVRMESRATVIDRIKDSVEKAMTMFQLDFQTVLSIPFVIEIEPGPVFAINSLKAVAELLGRTNIEYPILGLNADLSHLRLAGESEDFLKSAELHALCSNVHLSGGHLKGHIGDAEIKKVNFLDKSIIEKLAISMSSIKLTASVEFEAAPTTSSVCKSYQTLAAHL